MTFGSGGGGVEPAPKPEPTRSGDVSSQGRDLLPPDLPDEVDGVVPEFRSRRKAELLPPVRPAPRSKALDPTWCKPLAHADWQAGFRWGVTAAVGGMSLMVALAVGMLK